MPFIKEVSPSASPSAVTEVNNNQNPTASRNVGSDGAAVAANGATAIEEVRRSGRARQQSAKVRENNEQRYAAQEAEMARATVAAKTKRKQSGSSVSNGPKTSRPRVEDVGSAPLPADDASNSAAEKIDYIAILKGKVSLMEEETEEASEAEEEEEEDDDDDCEDEDDEEEDEEENTVPNKSNQKQSKRRGKGSIGNITKRALQTNFDDANSIKKHFPFFKDNTKYGRRNPPKTLLGEYHTRIAKAHFVSAWRRMSPNQQKDVCAQLAAREKRRAEERKALLAKEKRIEKAQKEAEKLQKQREKEEQKRLQAELRKEKKRNDEQKRRDAAKAIAQQRPITSTFHNPQAAVESSFSQQHLNNVSAKAKKVKVTAAASSARHLNDATTRRLEEKVRTNLYQLLNKITPGEGTEDNGWLVHQHMMLSVSELAPPPRGNGGPSTRNTVNDPNYDPTKPMSMTVHCASEDVFGDILKHLLNSNHPIVQAQLDEKLRQMQRERGADSEGEENARAVQLTISTEKPSSDSGDRAVAETTQSVSALAANNPSQITMEVVEADDTENLFV